MERARYLRVLSQLEYVYPTVSRNLRIAQKTLLEIPTTDAMKKAQRIWQFANLHPVIAVIVLLILCAIFLPIVLFSAFVLACLLIGLGIALATVTSFVVVAGMMSLPFVLPPIALTVIATASTYFAIRVTVAAARWIRGQIQCIFKTPSSIYQELHHRVSEFLLSCTGDLFISDAEGKPNDETDKTSEEREAEDIPQDKASGPGGREASILKGPQEDNVKRRAEGHKDFPDAQQGASGTTYALRGKRGHKNVPQDDDDSDDGFTEASEWLTEDADGNIIPDYRDKDMKLYDAMVHKGFQAYEPWPY